MTPIVGLAVQGKNVRPNFEVASKYSGFNKVNVAASVS